MTTSNSALTAVYGLMIPVISTILSDWLLPHSWLLPGYFALTVIGLYLLLGPLPISRRRGGERAATDNPA